MVDHIRVPTNYYSNTFLNPTRQYLLDLLKVNIRLVRAIGTRLFDTEGNEYVDFLAQYGALPFGHNNPEIWEALNDCFVKQTPSMVQPLIAIKAEELAAKLAAITPGDLTYTVFTNSGAESVEAAIKLARSRTGRTQILSTKNAFHGQTLGSLSATGRPAYHAGFGVPLAGFDHVPFGDLEALERKLDAEGAKIAAFIVEPIQGEGGIVPAPKGYLYTAQALCRRHGVLFIVDEIQTGLGRTGTLFAIEHEKVVPDMLLLAKALGGGVMPIGACISRPHVWDHHFGYVHNSTFANNNVAASVSLKVLEMLAHDDWSIIANVAQKGTYLLQELQAIQRRYPDVIKEVRGRGLMVGLEFYPFDGEESYTMAYFSKNDFLIAFFSGYLFNAHKIITAPAFNESHVLRIEPPLIITKEEIDMALKAIETLVDILEHRDYHKLVRYLVVDRNESQQLRDYKNTYRKQSVRSKHSSNDLESFAFLMHPIYEQDLISADPSFEQFTSEEFERWKDWLRDIGPGTVYHIPEVRSATGEIAQGWLIVLPMLPRDMLRYGRKEMMTFLGQSVDIAKRLGAKILGLGGFTAIISRGGQQLLGCGLPITTGNTLTALLAVEGIRRAAISRGLDLRSTQVAVVGATGSIGRLASLLLTPLVGGITLIGNPRSADSLRRCQIIAEEAYKETAALLSQDAKADAAQGLLLREIAQRTDLASNLPQTLINTYPGKGPGFFTITHNTPEAFANCEVIVLATSSDVPILETDDLMVGTIVCDIARPANIFPAVAKERPDLYVFDGGLAQLPDKVRFGPEVPHFREGIAVGCLAETMLLALEGKYTDHSIGPTLLLQEAAELREAMYKHGFSLPPLHE